MTLKFASETSATAGVVSDRMRRRYRSPVENVPASTSHAKVPSLTSSGASGVNVAPPSDEESMATLPAKPSDRH